jgi:transcriptional regulator with XRE-family HTH domain
VGDYDAFVVTLNRVRELRLRLFLTQEALAFRCRVTVRTVVHWERGEKYPHGRNLRRLARALGVSVDELQLGDRPGRAQPDIGS